MITVNCLTARVQARCEAQQSNVAGTRLFARALAIHQAERP